MLKKLRTIFSSVHFFSWTRRLLPWLVAAGVLYWLSKQYEPSEVFAALKLINPVYFSLLAVMYFLGLWAMDSYGTGHAVGLIDRSIPVKSLLAPRAATYLLAMVNYGAGQAAFAFALRRQSNLPLDLCLGLIALITATDLFLVVTLAFIGTFIGPHVVLGVNLVPLLRSVAGVVYLAVLLHLAYWLYLRRLAAPTSALGKLFLRVEGMKFFGLFARLRLRDYLRLLLWRAPIQLMAIVAMSLLAMLFSSGIPFHAIASNLPIAFLVGAIPISWGGLGTSNKTMADLLGPWVDPAVLAAHHISAGGLVVAMSLLWMLSNYVLKALAGVLALPRLTTGTKSPTPSSVS